MKILDAHGKEHALESPALIGFATFAYAIISRKNDTSIYHDVLLVRKKEGDLWEFPGGHQSSFYANRDGVGEAVDRVLSLPTNIQIKNMFREEFHFTQMHYRDSILDFPYDVLANVVTYTATLPLGTSFLVAPRTYVLEKSAIVGWVQSIQLQDEDVHPLCRAALRLYMRQERNEYPIR